MSKKLSPARELAKIPRTPGLGYHPLLYLKNIRASDVRGNLQAFADMPYPADPLVEPEYEGLTYLQVAIHRQMHAAAYWGSLESLEFIMDRLIGKPTQTNINVNATETYEQFLDRIAAEEKNIIDAEAKEILGE